MEKRNPGGSTLKERVLSTDHDTLSFRPKQEISKRQDEDEKKHTAADHGEIANPIQPSHYFGHPD